MTEPNRRGAWGAGRVAVRTLRETIENELNAGHSLTAIYARHQSRLGVSYEVFRYHVAREITKAGGARSGRTPRSLVNTTPTMPHTEMERPPIGNLDIGDDPPVRRGPAPGTKEWRLANGLPGTDAVKDAFVTREPNEEELWGKPNARG